jgi:regulator of protease activity HflC (stomatin/prohibitin superfamily)
VALFGIELKYIGLFFLSVILLALSPGILETNTEGFYQVKQAALTGNMTVRNTPGMYFQLFGEIHTYQLSDMYYFSKSDLDGGKGELADPIKVRFNDGGTAEVSGALKFRMSSTEKDQLMLHKDFKSFVAFKNDLIRQVVSEALMQTATLMRAEESYSTRRSEFTSLVEDQIKNGIYETVSSESKRVDPEGNEFVDRHVDVKVVNGQRVIRKVSPFVRYNIDIIQFVIKDIDFDETITRLISKKKEAEQQQVVARANAERAKQNAITAREEGSARVAEAEATALVMKKTAVVKAEQEKEVAQLTRMKAEEEAKGIVARGQAEAAIAKLKVSAGLTPEQKAQFAMNTAIGVAGKLSQVKFPSMLIIGGENGKGATNPFDAVGLESFLRINEKFAKDGE